MRNGQKLTRIQYDECLYDPDPNDESLGPQLEPGEDVRSESYWVRREQWSEATRKVVLPEPGIFQPPAQPKNPVDLIKDYGDRGLQVIVKLANIHLMPENPNYEGGTWHVEGQLVRSPVYVYK